MDTFECPVTWTTQVGPYTNLHTCGRPAQHVHHFDAMVQRIEPHRCHCGDWTPVVTPEPVK